MNPGFPPEHDDVELIEDFTPAQVDDVAALFDGEWWSTGRSRDEVEAILANSDPLIALAERHSGRVVAFARVVTDFITFAVVLDVIVSPDWRGRGLGKVLMDSIMQHPRLCSLRGIGLQCRPDLMEFYRRWGFDDTPGQSIQMKRVFSEPERARRQALHAQPSSVQESQR